jgi:energy-coupling factor transport system substrate-specific component
LLAASSLVVAGLGSWVLVRALAKTGVLAPFASGRDQALV